MSNIQIRTACKQDAETIHQMIVGLAKYEKAEHEVKATVGSIQDSLFTPSATAQALICEQEGEPIGYAVYFYNYSTWLGKNGLYLEDLYIAPECRGLGAGKRMLQHLAKIAVEKGCGRFEWSVLDWNEPAIEFYKSFGAKPQDEWVIYRLDGQALNDFAEAT